MTAGVSRRKVNVLIVEDNPADVGILRMALGDADLDCELTVIGDGNGKARTRRRLFRTLRLST